MMTNGIKKGPAMGARGRDSGNRRETDYNRDYISFSPARQITFKIDVSRMYRNKTGYQAGGYRLNTSFVTEEHTPESFIETVIKPGWPYTMVFNHDRSAQETGADARGVKTPKHTENFISRQELTFDDDSQETGVIDFWLRDPFFGRYGFAFVESVNSARGAEKGHPTIILDRPVTDPGLLKECYKAFIWRYSRLDNLHNIDRTIYNAAGAQVHYIGAVCPLETFEREILTPYRQHQAERERLANEERAARRRAFGLVKSQVKAESSAFYEYLSKSLDGIFDWLSSQTDERHNAILWTGRKCGEYATAHWTDDRLLLDIEERCLSACRANGYTQKYPDREISRVFWDGYRLGQANPAEEPILKNFQNQNFNEPLAHELKRVSFQQRYFEAAQQMRSKIAEKRAAYLAEQNQPQPGPVYKPGTVPFLVSDNAEYQETIVKLRHTFTSSPEWFDFVSYHFPELDAGHERRVKIEENRQRKIENCGRKFKRLSATGEIVTGRIQCGLCDNCQKLDRRNLKFRLLEIIGKADDMCLTLAIVDSREERRQLTRTLRDNETLYKCYPVEAAAGVEYHILFPGYFPDFGRILDAVDLTDDLISAWSDTVEGERTSGKLLESKRDLRTRYSEREEFETTADDTDAVCLELHGIVCEGELPVVAVDYEVNDLAGLQGALNEINRRTLKTLVNNQTVILGVITKNFYTPKVTESALCARFNEVNRAKLDRLKQKKR